MEAKVAVFGNADFVMPFSAIGVDTYPVGQEEDEILETARKIISAKYGLVVVAENIAGISDEVFSAHGDEPTPCVVVVPFTTESEGFATRSLGQVLKMATGIDILQN
jgi:V/A-type H+-transporting ATPase subunit F